MPRLPTAAAMNVRRGLHRTRVDSSPITAAATYSGVLSNPSFRYGKRLVPIVVLAVLLVYVSLRGVDWHELWESLRGASPPFLLLALGIVNASYFLRSLRWRLLLAARRRLTLWPVFCAMSIGYLMNSFLPARAGDFVRSAVIARKTTLGFAYALATTFAERVMDGVALVVVGSIGVTYCRHVSSWMTHTLWIMAAVACAGAVLLVGAPALVHASARIAGRILSPKLYHPAMAARIEEFLLGLRSLREPGRALGFSALTIPIWILDALAVVTVARALSLSLPLANSLVLLAALGLSSAVPSTPGYVGVYQFVAVTILIPLDYSRAHALALIFLYQGVVYCLILFWGAVFSWGTAGQWVRIARQVPDGDGSKPLDVSVAASAE